MLATMIETWREAQREALYRLPQLPWEGGGVSTGQLPTEEVVRALVGEAHQRFQSLVDGEVASSIPALATANPNHFGVCVAASNGLLFDAGDSRQPFSIQSLSKPFLHALICQTIGERLARQKLGVNSTGLPFNSMLHVSWPSRRC